MAEVVMLKNKDSGVVRKGLYGFSWTSFFWGFFVPLFRGDLKHTVVWFLAWFFTFGVSNIIQAFIYNKMYTKALMDRGYQFFDSEARVALAKSSLGVI